MIQLFESIISPKICYRVHQKKMQSSPRFQGTPYLQTKTTFILQNLPKTLGMVTMSTLLYFFVFQCEKIQLYRLKNSACTFDWALHEKGQFLIFI